MRLEDVAAALDRSDEALGETAALYRGYEVADQPVPGIGSDPAVDVAVGNDLDIALAERDEKQYAVAVMRIADDADSEIAVSETPRLAVLGRIRHNPQTQRQPIKDDHQDGKNRPIDRKADTNAELRP